MPEGSPERTLADRYYRQPDVVVRTEEEDAIIRGLLAAETVDLGAAYPVRLLDPEALRAHEIPPARIAPAAYPHVEADSPATETSDPSSID